MTRAPAAQSSKGAFEKNVLKEILKLPTVESWE